MKIYWLAAAIVLGTTVVSCKKKGCTDPEAINYNAEAKKDDNSCNYEDPAPYSTPSTYSFTDASGNSTVYFQGQTDRLDMLAEIVAEIKLGRTQVISATHLQDMFANTNDPFSIVYTKQLKDKCFALDVPAYEAILDSAAAASVFFGQAASNGQAGVLTSGTSTYLVGADGKDYAEIFEKGMMGAVFMYQALNVYFGEDKMNVDNSVAVDPTNGAYYTTMEHHWDEAFGYFGVPLDYPTTVSDRFWGEYCMAQDATLNSNADMMNNFLKGRAAITASYYTDRDAAILAIRKEWEDISAYQAMTYLDRALSYFGTDDAKFMHALSEAYGFAWNLRYAPEATRRFSAIDHAALMAMFPSNFWDITAVDINTIKAAIQAKF